MLGVHYGRTGSGARAAEGAASQANTAITASGIDKPDVSAGDLAAATGLPPPIPAAADVDVDVHAELKLWRLRTAKQQHTAAFRVFSDKTLMAIAHARPASFRELLQVKVSH